MAKLILSTMALSALMALALAQTCGKASTRMRPSRVHEDGQRIVGGVEARPNSHPWIVSLQQYGSHFCGGSLVEVPGFTKSGETDIVVTAAHCVYDGVSSLTASAGAHNLKRPTSTQQTVSASKYGYVYHPKYNPTTTLNDIAIIRLDKPVKFGTGVTPICLPTASDAFSGSMTVAGWGLTKEDGDVSNVLNQVDVPVIATKDCQRTYSRQGVDINGDAMICAAFEKGGKDSCQGDSGGPFIQLQNGQAKLAGVVSFGIGCARPGSPGVYARVGNYLSFIKEATGQLYAKSG